VDNIQPDPPSGKQNDTQEKQHYIDVQCLVVSHDEDSSDYHACTDSDSDESHHTCTVSEDHSHPFQQQRQQKRKTKRGRSASTSNTMKHTVKLICDSIPKNIDTRYIARKTSTDVKIVRFGATIGQTIDYVQNNAHDVNTPVIIHTGTNHMEKEGVSRTIHRLERLEYNLQRRGYKHVMMSSVVHRNSSQTTDRAISTINTRIALMCAKNNWTFVDNDNIDETCLSADGIHLNGIGDERMTLNICNGLNYLIH
jgi:hypothetical protein